MRQQLNTEHRASWPAQDEDGDWYETGLHIFFGAYPNMMNVFRSDSHHSALPYSTRVIFLVTHLIIFWST